jgi:hypothetical protein
VQVLGLKLCAAVLRHRDSVVLVDRVGWMSGWWLTAELEQLHLEGHGSIQRLDRTRCLDALLAPRAARRRA